MTMKRIILPCRNCCKSEIDVVYDFVYGKFHRMDLNNTSSKISLFLFFDTRNNIGRMALQNFELNKGIFYNFIDHNINPLNFEEKIKTLLTFS
jgi:hypothetical protein